MGRASWTAARMLQLLREAGYRVTAERRVVVETILSKERGFTGGDLVSELVARDPSVGRATVFRTLEVLVGLGLVGRVHQPHGGQVYVLCPQGHHHHAICSACGAVLDLAECPLGLESQKEARAAGFRLEGHRLEYYGTCRPCQEKEVG